MCPDALTEVLRCVNCRRLYPETGAPYRCPTCGGVYDLATWPAFDPQKVDKEQPGLWRYQHALALGQTNDIVSLNEGDTPLEWRKVAGRDVAFKLESKNPTGSFKDRGSAPLVEFLCRRGIRTFASGSSTNAGISLAAYSAQAGLAAKIYIPDNTPAAKRRVIQAYGTQVVRIMGSPSNAALVLQKEAEDGHIYAGHTYSPFVLPGYATIAYELYEQLGRAPGTLIVPTGQGNLLVALGRAYQSLQRSGLIEQMPRLVGVQAMACAPLWAVWRYGAAGLGWVSEGKSLAEELLVKHPARGDSVLMLMNEVRGIFVTADEEEIPSGRDQLSDLGFNVEPSAAIVWSALMQVVEDAPDPVVVLLTGSADKSLTPA